VSSPRLTETSFVVLGLLELAGEATPYDLKRVAQVSVFNFWSVPHTQIYTECERLAAAGLLAERREEGGRRRRFYKLTAAGGAALDRWRAEPTEGFHEIRDPGTLKLFFGGDSAALAVGQLRVHKAKLEEAYAVEANPDLTPGMRLALELGINQERALVRFWSRQAKRARQPHQEDV
jgi:PadR family transcriptional regulator AphA